MYYSHIQRMWHITTNWEYIKHYYIFHSSSNPVMCLMCRNLMACGSVNTSNSRKSKIISVRIVWISKSIHSDSPLNNWLTLLRPPSIGASVAFKSNSRSKKCFSCDWYFLFFFFCSFCSDQWGVVRLRTVTAVAATAVACCLFVLNYLTIFYYIYFFCWCEI